MRGGWSKGSRTRRCRCRGPCRSTRTRDSRTEELLLGFLDGQLLQVGAQPFVLVRDEIEEETLRQVLTSLLVGHLLDDRVDLADGVLEGAIELAPGGQLAVQRFQQRQQVAVE